MAQISPAGVFDTTYEEDMSVDRTRRDKLWKNLAFLALLLVPLLSVSGPLGLGLISDQYVSLIGRIAISVIAVQGLNLLVGYTGIAGCLLAYARNSLSLDAFQFDVSIEMLAMLIIGGAGYPLGAMFGVTFIRLLQEAVIPTVRPWLSDALPQLFPFIHVVNITSAINPILFGGALIIFLVLEPRGIAHRWEVFKVAWKIRPYAY